MSHILVLICRVDDPTSDQMTELAAFDLPAVHIVDSATVHVQFSGMRACGFRRTGITHDG